MSSGKYRGGMHLEWIGPPSKKRKKKHDPIARPVTGGISPSSMAEKLLRPAPKRGTQKDQ